MIDKEERVRDAIDWNLGVEQFGGDEEMFAGMVGKFEELTFNDALRKLHDGILARDWKEVRSQSHTLKGASSYLAATTVQDLSLQMQLRCDRYHKLVDEGNVTSGEKEAFEHDIIELFLLLLQEGKFLKERISQITNEPYDLSQIELYEIDIKRRYIAKQPVCCNCKIF